MEGLVSNTFWMDFTIADAFGVNAIKDTFNRAFKEWKGDYQMLTALVVILNHKIWEHYEHHNDDLAKLYDSLWRQAEDYALTNLKDDELQYYYDVTD